MAAGRGTVRVKLFNLLLPELGPLILARGILVTETERAALLQACEAGPGSGESGDSPTLLRIALED